MRDSRSRARLVIVDDSPIVRRVLRRLVEPDLTVVGEGEDAADAIRLATHLRPDLLLIDVNMPGADGMSAIESIMARAPTRIVVVTSVVRYGKHDAIHSALSRGALDLIAKNDVLTQDDGAAFRARLAALALARLPGDEAVPTELPLPMRPSTREAGEVILIGASTGGPRALQRILSALPASFPVPLLIGQHMTSEFGESFIEWLSGHTPLTLVEAVPGARPRPGEAHLLIRGGNLGFAASGSLVALAHTNGPHTPALDPLFNSAATVFGARATGVILTGMGDDGVAGLAAMQARGALTITESSASAIVDGMPRAARDAKAARFVWSLEQLIAWLTSLQR